MLLRLLALLRPYAARVVGQYLLMIAGIALGLASPQLMRLAVDRGVGGRDIGVLALAVFGILGLTTLRGVCTFLVGRWSEIASQGVAFDLRNALHRKLTSLSFSYHDRTRTGDHLSRVIQDVDRVRFLTGRALLRLAEAVVVFTGALLMLLTMNRRLTLLIALGLPVLALQAFYLGRWLRPLSSRLQDALAILTTRLEQNLRGARVVKAYAQEAAEIERFEAENTAWFRLASRSAVLQSFIPPLLALTAGLGSAFVIWYGGREVVTGGLTMGGLVAFIAYLTQLLDPLRRFGVVIPAIALGVASGERVLAILDTDSDVADTPGAVDLPRGPGRVRFDRVSFAYGRGEPALRDVTFEVSPGESVALLGATGCGKSTVIQLIPRFYDVSGGRILVDDRDVREVTLASLRDRVGIVLQESTLFASSLRDNIRFGRPEATDAEIESAARAAQAHEFITALPHGYDQVVGEKGITLSGGQRQRVAIARALLRDPRILILDDATSSVDTETERQIQIALEELMRGRTSFIIAQRLATVKRASRILVLREGAIEAMGSHDELLRCSPTYGQVYSHQLEKGPGADA